MKTMSCPNCGRNIFGRVCSTCGYSDELSPTEPTLSSVATHILMTLGLLLIIFAVVYFIDFFAFDSRFFNRTMYGTDCAYKVPSGYKIVYNSDTKKYAVRDLTYDDYYLWNGRNGIEGMYSSIATPSLFTDSCTAKAYLKAYVKGKEKSGLKGYK